MPNHESIIKAIATDLMNGKKLMVTDADCVERIQQLESEIARLKGDNERLRARISTLNKEVNKWIDSSAKYRTELNQLRESAQPSPDLEKRERMAWELYVHNSTVTIEKALELVDTFLAKSKEVSK